MIASIDSNAVGACLKRAWRRRSKSTLQYGGTNARITATVAMDETATGAAAAHRMIDLLRKRSEANGQKAFRLVISWVQLRRNRCGFGAKAQQGNHAPSAGSSVDMVEVVTIGSPSRL